MRNLTTPPTTSIHRTQQTGQALKSTRAVVLLMVAAACLGTGAKAQMAAPAQHQPPPSPLTSMPPSIGQDNNTRSGMDVDIERLNTELIRKRNIERQQKMVEDADRLVAMANALKASVDKTTKDVLSIEVLKQADEVERLARSVKDKMRAD